MISHKLNVTLNLFQGLLINCFIFGNCKMPKKVQHDPYSLIRHKMDIHIIY